MCIKLVLKTNLYYDARSEKHQSGTYSYHSVHTVRRVTTQRWPTLCCCCITHTPHPVPQSGSNKEGRNPAHFPFNTHKAAVLCHKLCHKVISCKSCLERNLFLRLPLPAAHTKQWRLSAVSVQSTAQTVFTALSPYHGQTINIT
jgi:hypothetical protein